MGKKSAKRKAKNLGSAFDSQEQLTEAFRDILNHVSAQQTLSIDVNPRLLEETIEEYMLNRFGNTPNTYKKMIELVLLLDELSEESIFV